MKYLILILIAFNSYADIRVTVIDHLNRTSCVNGCKFKSQQLASDWITDNQSNDSWGKPKRWEEYESQTNCLQFRDRVETVDIEGVLTPTVTGQDCQLAAEYTICGKAPDVVDIAIDCEDITAEVQSRKDKALAKKTLRDKLNGGANLTLPELNELIRN